MSHRHGSIPPEENLQLYMEFHAMMVAAGELVDARLPIHVPPYDDADDPWQDWLGRHLPHSPNTWLADLRSAVPAEPDLFGHLRPLDEWTAPIDDEYDAALQLVEGHLPDPVLVTGSTSLHRPGGYGSTYINSALVAPFHAADLQRALAAASDPTDWKLPYEDEDEFEVDHGSFVLRGWLTDVRDSRDTLDEHDPYAHGLRRALPLPGHRFRKATGATADLTGLVLRGSDGIILARAEQWADADSEDRNVVTSSGNRTYVDRGVLLHHLAEADAVLIVEVQIGRHRDNTDYRPPRSRIYLVDQGGVVTSR
jgi:hypothetical protein